MDTKKLEALLTAVELGSFTRAAEVLGWTARADIDSIIASAWNWHSRNPEGFAE